MPFGVTNGTAVFQRKMDQFVTNYDLDDTFPFMDNVTISGSTQEEHDENLKAFKEAACQENLTLSEEKCVYSAEVINLLGYRISHNSIKPDPQTLEPLLNLSHPNNPKKLKRIIGMFSYYAKWIKCFSDKIHVLNNVDKFPFKQIEIDAFKNLKRELAEAAMQPIDENIPFTVETDASAFAISATLNQDGRPVAFHSRTLKSNEQYHSLVEKEAQAIVESIHHWKHFLLGRHFTLITDAL